jgi:hypothetical protein
MRRRRGDEHWSDEGGNDADPMIRTMWSKNVKVEVRFGAGDYRA